MYTTTTTKNGKFYGLVRSEDERTLFTTPGYVTEAMALADAKCWLAFNKGETMREMHVNNGVCSMSDLGRMCIKCREEVLSGDFEARNDLHQLHAVTSTDLQRRVEQAFSFASQGVKVSLKTNWQGREYIEIHNGGSSYGQYFRAA